MMKRSSVLIAVFLGIAVIGASAFALRTKLRDVVDAAAKPSLPAAQPYVAPPSTKASEDKPALPPVAPAQPAATPVADTPKPAPSKPPASGSLSTQANLAVPFTSQAPHADWSMPYDEACEETSLVMAQAYFKGETSLSPDTAAARIMATVAWENKTFGYYKDTTAAEVARMAKEYFGLQAEVKSLGSIDDAKREVSAGKVVLFPAAGKLLGNPYFRSPGPVYHMLVVKGWLKDGRIITNDPGTKRGADYLYDPKVLFGAAHDWNGGDVEHGAKVMIVITK